ncbi:MAG: hypothetical protein H7836_11425 [Magnetococcus sp. YQC-3]
MTFYGLRAYLQGLNVYSNYHLEFPHKRLQSIDDIMHARDGLVLLDDLEAWLSSRNWKSKENQQVMQIILQGGKRRLTVLFSCKRPENVDVLLRDTTDFWCRCTLIPKTVSPDMDFEEYIKYLDNLLLCIEVFDDSVEPVNITYIDDLPLYASLYSTREEVEKLEL